MQRQGRIEKVWNEPVFCHLWEKDYREGMEYHQPERGTGVHPRKSLEIPFFKERYCNVFIPRQNNISLW